MSAVVCERRTRRQDPGHARVQPRELVGLEFLSRAGTMRTDQYARLLGMHPRIGRRSAQKLRDLGLVDAKLTALHESNRLVLTRAGAREVARATGRDPDELRPLSGIGNLDLDHHDLGVDLGIALTVAYSRSRTWHLERLLFEREVRSLLRAAPGVLVPDLVAVLVDGAGERVAIVGEVDLGTENVSYVVSTKGRGYQAARERGEPVLGCTEWRVAVVTNSARRRNRLSVGLWEAGAPEGLWYLADAESVTPENVLLPTWWTPRMTEGGRARLVQEALLPPRPTRRSDGWTGLTRPEAALQRDPEASSPPGLLSAERT